MPEGLERAVVLAFVHEDAVHELEFIGGFDDAGFAGLSGFEFVPGVAPAGGHRSEHIIYDPAFGI